MNARRLVDLILDSEEQEYVPPGYTQIDSYVGGDYVLKLWSGIGHVGGSEQKFYEISLNKKGHSFATDNQNSAVKGSVLLLGHRRDLVAKVSEWTSKYGTIYVGSVNQRKLQFYRKIIGYYLTRFHLSDYLAPFDECDGVPEYFAISQKATMARESLEETDISAHVDDAPAYTERLQRIASRKLDDLFAEGEINPDNLDGWIESIAMETVHEFLTPAKDHLTGTEETMAEEFVRLVQYLNRYAGDTTASQA